MSNELKALIKRVEGVDEALAHELRKQFDSLSGRLEYGLNFERHTPESVALVGRRITVGDKVRFIPPRGETVAESDATWVVVEITGKKGAQAALLIGAETQDQTTGAVDDLVYVADFRDPIYPGLVSTGRVERGGDKPFHAIITAENYHALEALLYTHQDKVDAIYIDPPYNTRANDWKYNNDYVDPGDDYAHSMWLAFMERRLKLARRLLNLSDSVLIVTIDENEVHRLALLVEQTFRGAKLRMISTLINPKGVGVTEGFKRVDEYIFIVRFGAQQIVPSNLSHLGSKPTDPVERRGRRDADEYSDLEDTPAVRVGLDWQTFRRRDLSSVRPTRPSQFYPIYVNVETGLIELAGEPISHEQDRHTVETRDGCVAVFPVRDDGTEMNWGTTRDTFIERWRKGFARAGRATPGKPQPYIIQYLKTGPITDIAEGRAIVEGINADGSVIAYYQDATAKAPPTQWHLRSHNAEHYGTKVLRALLPGRDFPFPKSLYAVEDVLRLFVSHKPDALVVDFFGGSGTTAHAVMRLNKQHPGRRRCIVVSNNEVSPTEETRLRAAGHRPGDPEWEALGICDYITKPRIAAALTGQTPGDAPVYGDYKFTDLFPMADGFEENVEFFTMTYETPALVELDLAFERIAPLLWLRAGSKGRRIEARTETYDVADTYSVLFSIDATGDFLTDIEQAEGLRIAYIVTDDETQFQAIAGQLPGRVAPVRLYESYLRTFQINTGRA